LRRPTRAVLALASLLVALGLAAVVVAPWIVDADRFRPRVETRLAEILGRKVTLGHLRLSLLTGLALVAEGVRVGEPPAAEPGAGFEIAAGRVAVRPAILPLLRGEVVVRSVSLRDGSFRAAGRTLAERLSARVRLGRAEDGSSRVLGRIAGSLPAFPGAPDFRADFDASIVSDRLTLAALRAETDAGRLEAEGEVDGIATGRLRVSLSGETEIGRSRASGTVTVSGLAADRPELEFRVTSPLVDFDELARLAGVRRAESPSAGILGALLPAAVAAETPPRAEFLSRWTGGGTIEAARGRLAGLELTGLSARVKLERGTVRFEDAAFALYGGRHVGSFELDLVSLGAPFRLVSRLDGVDSGRLLAALDASRGEVLHGIAALALDIAGEAGAGPVAGSLRGSARAELKDGRFLSVGILKQVAQILEMAGGRGIGRDETPFDHVSASFGVHDGRADTKDLEFRSADLDLDGGGSVGLGGSLALDVTASFSRRASADLVRETPQLKFRLDPDGRLTMPLKIRGDLKTPLVQLDLDRVLQEGLERSARDRGRKGLLRRLLGGE
jgi:uncharacterized protein involved in outer membrane biogenesis